MELERLNSILRHFLLSAVGNDSSSLIDLEICGTYENQNKLPHLPVPKLEDAFELYLQSLLPLLNAKDHQHVKQLVEEALKPNSFIRELQKRLLEYKEKQNALNKSWLEDWWLEAAYLAYRAPSPTNSNFLFLFDTVLNIQDSNPQTKHAAMIINGTLGFKEYLVDKELVKPQFLRGNTPLCMDQYDKIFTRTRVPHPGSDYLRVYEPTKHIVVISNSQFFELKVLGDDNKPFPIALIQSELNKIEEVSKNNKAIEIGAVTGASRDDWAEVRDKLYPLNKETFESIETALFTISLDHDAPTSEDQTAEFLMVAGPNSTGNRWYDKLSHWIVFENGRAGFNGEHAPLDAPAIGACVDYCLDAVINNKLPTNFSSEKLTPFKPLTWVIPSELLERIQFHVDEAKILAKKCDLRIVRYRNYGGNFIKDIAKISPDAYMQMAIQLAFYRIHRYSVATYETGATRQYFHGRTETVRTLSYHSQKFTQAMVNPNSTPEECRQLLKIATDAHTKYMKRAVDGNAIDRHMLGLRLCLQPGEQKPEIFSHFSWPLSTSFRLSTSNLLQKHFLAGFGPTEADGYGVCYAIKDNMIQCTICSFTPCHETSSEAFKQSILQSFQEMAALFA